MLNIKSIQENRIDEKLNRSGRTKKQQVIYRTLYMLATDYIRSDENAKYRDANPYTKIELADKLLELANEFDWKCTYTGCALNLETKDIWKISFDRIDNSKPHTPDNMVTTAKWLNCVRGNMPYDQWMQERPWDAVYEAMKAAKQ